MTLIPSLLTVENKLRVAGGEVCGEGVIGW